MISDKEHCARLLRKIWIKNGVVSASAFNLRPNIHETYISLLREEQLTYHKDLISITKDDPIAVASLWTGDVRAKQIYDNVKLDIKEVDNNRLLSHCGLFIYVDGKTYGQDINHHYPDIQHGAVPPALSGLAGGAEHVSP